MKSSVFIGVHLWFLSVLFVPGSVATASSSCTGDCDRDGSVSLGELVIGVNVGLGRAAVDACPAIDPDGDGAAAIGELVAGVGNSLDGCPVIDLLVFSLTRGFRHPSIADAHAFFTALAPAENIRATITEDPETFTDEGLTGFDVIVFANTTGDVLDAAQQAAMERFIRSGKGYVGVHSAADTEYEWSWYGRLVGAYFVSHPLLPVEVEVTTEDPLHPSTAHLEPTFTFTDEIYNFDRNPRKDNAILLTIDEAGFTYPNFPLGSPSMGDDHPVAWYNEFDGGRSFYTNGRRARRPAPADCSPCRHEETARLFYAVELSYTDQGGPNGEPSLTGRDSILINVE